MKPTQEEEKKMWEQRNAASDVSEHKEVADPREKLIEKELCKQRQTACSHRFEGGIP